MSPTAEPPPPRPAPAQFADVEAARSAASAFDLRQLPADYFANPYPYYHALRAHAPVHRLPDGSYFLSRYADCATVYKDVVLFSSDKKREFRPKYGDSLLYQHHTTSLVFNDPPLHTRVRRIIAGAFTPRAIADLEQPVIDLVDTLLDRLGQNGGGDLIADFAAAVPVEVIGNLLGVPRQERGPLRDWSLAILGALEPTLTPEQQLRGECAVHDFLDYLKGLVADRRAKLGDPEHDVLTRLIEGERSAGKLSELELLHNIIFILNAGHETTTNLIGNGLHALLEWPQVRARLIANPMLIRSAVEEILRFESSNQLGNRVTSAPTELGGVVLPAGSFLTIGIGAANRDPAEFANPDVFDIAREPNRHLAFGSGPHVCAGLNIARLEGRIAIGRLLARFPGYRLAGAPVRGGRARFRGFLALPARLA
ncbi:MAG TPA: cytochrome P450 [Hyphomicrobiaceae bacterium]|jgi:cytochrome P450|nr:cytochrome P450 [Hyphomicrobiaceae bacterium]